MRRTTQDRLEKLVREIENKEKTTLFISSEWREGVPRNAGVYVIWRKDKPDEPVYVGESCNLYKRFGDLGRPANHTFASQMDKKHPWGDELKTKISQKFVISYIELDFGRKELEEYLVVFKWKRKKLINKPYKRLCENEAYTKLLSR
jgi:hypothetical protein